MKEIKAEKNIKAENDVVIKDNKNISYFEKILEFWNKDLKKTFIIISIITLLLVIFFANVTYQINLLDKSMGIDIMQRSNAAEALKTQISKTDIIKSKLSILGLTTMAGIVPYFYLPVFGLLGYVLIIGKEIGLRLLEYNPSQVFSVFYAIASLLDIMIISLITSIGIYWTKMSTKRYLYSKTKRYSMINLKLQFNELLKKEDKVKEIENKIEKRNQKQEKNNVKIKYLEMLVIVIVIGIIQVISILISTI